MLFDRSDKHIGHAPKERRASEKKPISKQLLEEVLLGKLIGKAPKKLPINVEGPFYDMELNELL